LPKVPAAHRAPDRGRKLLRREAGLRPANPVDRYPPLAFPRLCVRTNILEPFNAREQANDVRSQFVETRCRVAGDLQGESFASTLLVKLEVGLADRDDRQVLLDPLDDLRGREGGVLFLAEQQGRQDRKSTRL